MKKKKGKRMRNIGDSTFTWVSKCIMLDGYTKKIGAHGLAVYNILATCANKNQECWPAETYIAETLNCSRNTVSKYLKLLEKYKIINVKRRNRYCNEYKLLNIKCTTMKHKQVKKFTVLAQQIGTNDNNDTQNDNKKENKNDFIESNESKPVNKNAENSNLFQKTIKENNLALQLANALNDMKGLPFYRNITQKHTEEFLMSCLDDVLKISEGKIKKSRAALFNHLIKLHGKENN